MESLWLIILLALPYVTNSTISKKSVITSLHAKWPQTPFIAEASEFMAHESDSLFWAYIDEIVEKLNVDEWHTYSDAKQYDLTVRLAGYLLQEARVNLLKFALSLRAHSPAVLLFQRLGAEKKKSCAAFADIHGILTCDVNDLEKVIENDMKGPAPTVYSIDHVFPATKEHNVTLIIYGELGSASWRKFHLAAKALSRGGKARYVLRHFVKDVRDDKLLLSGYGVELAIKSTEYKAVDDSNTVTDKMVVEESSEEYIDNEEDNCGFNFNILRRLHHDLKESIEQFRLHLLERDELTPLKVWQVQELSYQTAQRIVQAGPQKAINIMTDSSQNFPLSARSLSRQIVRKEFISEVSANQEQLMEYGISEGESIFLINGIMVDIDALDVFQVLDLLKQEEKLANGFFRMGIKNEYLSMLMDLELSNERLSYALDFRSASPEYLNNLDTDKQYRQWANSVGLLLQPYFPGMLRPIARNLFTLIFVVDPSQKETRDLLHYALRFYAHEIPVRLGVVFVTNDEKETSGFDDASVAMLNLYNFIKMNNGIQKALDVLTEVLNVKEESVSPKDVLSYFQIKYPNHDPNDVFGSDSDYNNGRSTGYKFLRDSGLGLTPKVLLNGIVLDDSGITADHFEETVMMEIMRVTSRLQKAVMEKKLKDQDNVMNWILSQPEVMPRINKLILDSPLSPNALYLDLTSAKKCTNVSPAQYYKLPSEEQNQCMLKGMRYITRTEEMKTHFSTVWVVTDLETVEGRLLAYNAVRHLKRSYTMRVAIINNPKDIKAATTSGSITMLVNIASRLLVPRQMKSFVTKLVKEEIVSKLLNKQITLDDLAVNDMNMTFFYKESKQINSDEIVADARYSKDILGLKPGQLALVVNGLLIGPLSDGEVLDVADMELIDKLILLRGGKVIGDYMEKWKIQTRHGESSDMVARSMALIGSGVAKKRRSIALSREKESVVTIYGNNEEGIILVLCIVDPLSTQAQRLGHLLTVIQKVVNVEVKLVMNPRAKLSELPLKRFYRLVLQPTVMFDDSGRIDIAAYEARFTALPNKQLLTLAVVPPDAWMVQSVYAIYDLDNIRLENVAGNVLAKFELEHILLEGHCFDDITGSPPRGLQFTLGTLTNPSRYDTIVMANLGYFQLKADPGAWILNLRDGKSKDIYNIVSHVNTELEDETGVNVLIDSFSGRTIRIRVAKKKGREKENLLSEKSEGESEDYLSVWSSISTTSKSGGEKYDAINIFSLASGHLYERFLRIMILSVMKHTKHPVNFWLLKNYLSPNFKETLPQMAKHYGFKYEFIEYRWPRWLHQQTEKQRVMWGYKILFLDVLFPLSVRKIIFVDADQIVRTDLMELMELDLGGAPYGFTPFCDSRTSMDGFRFWKKGYWANHLAGRKYHISALYVIDLVKFRQVAAGDRLRGQYQGLSADPNSLSNLDQDLPNNMIHQVRIKSLPQEWLWCETWCDDASKEKAKTIDLCNNPQTKEPKLDSAMRIIPEWKDYDAEIKVLLDERSKKYAEERKSGHKAIDEHTEL
ncbi:UDP-glucose:Glycoprotein Glucosyltransferase containing protein [Loa loa]|uniref:UDP-glucose:Glycoprotein Glucosyltransferase containing protein n=1 Tax=Loa loa TaxID=7209 RepID=A0A1I7W223_LOALO|nr:UDP-glucose:Glycoprotein Glucosyltransferase containing protein [Loa loa]EFO25210.1 UDP-glucose:Glycoprotein Glucosyltransferase containing protein [Loa loa]